MALASERWQPASFAELIVLIVLVSHKRTMRMSHSRSQWASLPPTLSSILMINVPYRACSCLAHCYAVLTHLSGEVVSLYGTSGPYNGPYSVQLDGGEIIQYNASNIYPTNYGVMIYHADNLGSGTHQLLLTNLPAVTSQSLTIDYAQLWTATEYVAIESMIHSPC